MTVTSKGYDPLLGQKVAAESTGYVFGLGRSPRKKSEAQIKQEWIEEHGTIPDAQQLFDAQMYGVAPVNPKAGSVNPVEGMGRMVNERFGPPSTTENDPD